MEPDPIEELLNFLGEQAIQSAKTTLPFLAAGASHNAFADQNDRLGRSAWRGIRTLTEPSYRAERRKQKAFNDLWFEIMSERADEVAPPARQALNLGDEFTEAVMKGPSTFGKFFDDVLRSGGIYGLSPRKQFLRAFRGANPIGLAVSMALEEILLRGAQNEELMGALEESMNRQAEGSKERVPSTRRSPTGS